MLQQIVTADRYFDFVNGGVVAAVATAAAAANDDDGDANDDDDDDTNQIIIIRRRRTRTRTRTTIRRPRGEAIPCFLEINSKRRRAGTFEACDPRALIDMYIDHPAAFSYRTKVPISVCMYVHVLLFSSV